MRKLGPYTPTSNWTQGGPKDAAPEVTVTLTNKTKIAKNYVSENKGVEKTRVVGFIIHAYGTMPNTSKKGWYCAGDVETLYRMSLAENSNRLLS